MQSNTIKSAEKLPRYRGQNNDSKNRLSNDDTTFFNSSGKYFRDNSLRE
jgi:hypothetical protein